MSEKSARRQRAAKAAQPPTPELPAAPSDSLTIPELLQLLGAKEVQIAVLQRQVAGLQQQMQMLVDQYVRKEEKKPTMA